MPSFDSGGFDDGLGGISLPPAQPPKSVLKKPPSVLDKGKSILCPGVPSCLPPPIADYEVEEYEETTRKRKIKFGDESYEPGDESDEDGEEKESRRGGGGGGGETLTTTPAPQPNSLQKKMLAMAGQDLDQFMKEMEVVHKTREAEKAAELSQRLARLEGEDGSIAPPGIEVGSSVVSRIVLKRSLCIMYISRPLLAQCLQDHRLVALLHLLEGFYPLDKTKKLDLWNFVAGPSHQSMPHPCDLAWHLQGFALPQDLLLGDHQCALQHSFPGI